MVLSLREFDEELSDADVEALNQAVKLMDEINARFKRMEESMQNQIATTKNQTQQLAKMADIFEKKFGCTSSPHLPLPQSEIQINHSENSSSELLQIFRDADDSMKLNSCLNSTTVDVDQVITTIEVSHVDSHAVLCVENEETVEIEAIDETLEFETSWDVLGNNLHFCTPTVRKNVCESFCFGYTNLLEGQFKVLWYETELGILVLSSIQRCMLLLCMSTRFYRRELKLLITIRSLGIIGICGEVYDPGIWKAVSWFSLFVANQVCPVDETLIDHYVPFKGPCLFVNIIDGALFNHIVIIKEVSEFDFAHFFNNIENVMLIRYCMDWGHDKVWDFLVLMWLLSSMKTLPKKLSLAEICGTRLYFYVFQLYTKVICYEFEECQWLRCLDICSDPRVIHVTKRINSIRGDKDFTKCASLIVEGKLYEFELRKLSLLAPGFILCTVKSALLLYIHKVLSLRCCIIDYRKLLDRALLKYIGSDTLITNPCYKSGEGIIILNFWLFLHMFGSLKASQSLGVCLGMGQMPHLFTIAGNCNITQKVKCGCLRLQLILVKVGVWTIWQTSYYLTELRVSTTFASVDSWMIAFDNLQSINRTLEDYLKFCTTMLTYARISIWLPELLIFSLPRPPEISNREDKVFRSGEECYVNIRD